MSNQQVNARIQEGLAQAQCGEFVTEVEMESFFSQNAPTPVEALWIDECVRRCAAIDKGKAPLIDADEVMLKYRQ
jgi:Putative addiction module component